MADPPHAADDADAAAATPPAEEAAALPAAPPPSTPRLGALFSTSLTQQWLFGIPIRAIELGVAAGGPELPHKKVRSYFATNLLVGETRAGVNVTRATFGARVERRFDPYHLGVIAGGGLFWFDRAGGGTMLNLTASANVFVGRDFELSNDGHALTVEANFGASHLPGHDSTVLFGPGVTVGLRFH